MYPLPQGARCRPPGAFFSRSPSQYERIQRLPQAGQKVLIGDKTSVAVAEAIGLSYVNIARSPIADLKAIKNATEIEGFRACHIRDGAALVRYFAWLEEQLN